MILDDIIYISLLCLSVGLGPLIKNITSPFYKQWLTTFAGFVIVYIVSGPHMIHSIIVTLVNAVIVLFIRRKSHIISAVFCFGYLAFFRSTHYFGLDVPPAHTNAIQMILTLKMVGLAFELNESKQSEITSGDVFKKYKNIDPSFLDIFHYAFCVAGVLIGPYYKFRTYWDMLHMPYSTHACANTFLKDRIKVVPFYVACYLIGSYFYPLEFVTSSKIYEKSFWYKVWYMTPSFFNFRMRIYSGFILGECVCIAMGLGAYPKSSKPQPGAGPTDILEIDKINKSQSYAVEYSFETVKNIYEYGSEFWPTIREGIRSWNRTVQYWLASFVYKKLCMSKPAKIFVTMLVSSFWHGVHPGYYLCLCSAPLFLFVESEIEKVSRQNLSSSQQAAFEWMWWIIKMQSFSYMGMPFLLLNIKDSLYFWKSIYFCGHIFIIVIYFIALGLRKHKNKKE